MPEGERNRITLQNLLITITIRVTTHPRYLVELINTFQFPKSNSSPSINQSARATTIKLLVYHNINSNLPRHQRVLLPRSTTAALINRDEGRKIRGPTITSEVRSVAVLTTVPLNISEYSRMSEQVALSL